MRIQILFLGTKGLSFNEYLFCYRTSFYTCITLLPRLLVLTNIFLCYRTSFYTCITLASSSFSFNEYLLCYRTSFYTCITLASLSFSFIALLLVLSNIFSLYNLHRTSFIAHNMDVFSIRGTYVHDIDVMIFRYFVRKNAPYWTIVACL